MDRHRSIDNLSHPVFSHFSCLPLFPASLREAQAFSLARSLHSLKCKGVTTPRSSRKNKPDVSYIQLAHNVRDKKTGQVKASVLYNFGRADQPDVGAIRRLVRSLSRFLTPEEAPQLQGGIDQGFEFLGSRPQGGAWVLRRLWARLNLDRTMKEALRDRAFSSPVEWAIFAMVANRALAHPPNW